MNELTSILEHWKQGGPDLDGAVLASVVHVKGSAYRRPGARMLILPDGSRIGTISGGCLETEVARKAEWWTSRGGPTLRTFDTSTEQAAWDFGLGCNGVITVLLERVSSPAVAEQMRFLDRLRLERRAGVLATVVRAEEGGLQPGDRLLWEQGDAVGGSLRGTSVGHTVIEAVRKSFASKEHRWVSLRGLDVFVEWVAPPQRLVLFGAGHDAIPLVAMARLLGWSIVVVDNRPQYARPERFPGAESVVLLPASGQLDDLPIDAEAAVVMMTHNYPLDLALLPRVLARSPRYLGMLGPRKRTERLFAEAGISHIDERVYGPVGLDLGGDQPEAVALAVASEIQAVVTGRNARFLRDRPGPIHGDSQDERGVATRRPIPTRNLTPVACGVLATPRYA